MASKNLTRKQLVVAAGVLGVALVGVAAIVAWTVHTPVSKAPTDAECRSSERCRTDGECTVRGGVCVAGSDADCAQSDVCKKGGECTSSDGHCLTAARAARARRELEAAADAKSRSEIDPLVQPWLALIESAAKGQVTTLRLGAYISAEELRGFELEKTTPALVGAEQGTATWNGRGLPAAVVRVTLPLVNRQAGERRQLCLVQTAIHDEEFKMWRGMLTYSCTEPNVVDKLQEWRSSNAFTARKVWPSTGVIANSADAGSPRAPSSAQP